MFGSKPEEWGWVFKEEIGLALQRGIPLRQFRIIKQKWANNIPGQGKVTLPSEANQGSSESKQCKLLFLTGIHWKILISNSTEIFNK